jgi:hypothetical protein
MKTRRAPATPLIVLTALALFAAPDPVSLGATRAAPECPQNSLCVWSKANYEGDRLVIDRLGASNKIFKKMNDRVSSARLRYSGGAARLYEDPDGEGDTLCLLDAPGLKKYPDLSEIGYDNIMSSSYLSAEPFGTCF